MSEEKGKEIEIMSSETLATPLADDQLLAVAEQAEKRIEAVNKIKRIALRVTNTRDWVDQGGKPYLAVSGAEKVARLFGISWRVEEPKLVNEEAGHFRFEYKGEFSMGVVSIEVVGIRSSTSPFFSRSHGKDIPASEVDRGNVKKSAFTNCIGNGVTRLLGIRNMDWEDLKSAGIDITKIARVEYKKEQAVKTQEAPADTRLISKPQAKRLWAIAKARFTEQGVLDDDQVDLAKVIVGEFGFEHTKDITREKYEAIVEKLQNWIPNEEVLKR